MHRSSDSTDVRSCSVKSRKDQVNTLRNEESNEVFENNVKALAAANDVQIVEMEVNSNDTQNAGDDTQAVEEVSDVKNQNLGLTGTSPDVRLNSLQSQGIMARQQSGFAGRGVPAADEAELCRNIVRNVTLREETSDVQQQNFLCVHGYRKAGGMTDEPVVKKKDLCMLCSKEHGFKDKHHICCFKCGHVFKKNCIEEWIRRKKQCCPICLMSAKIEDIKIIRVVTLKHMAAILGDNYLGTVRIDGKLELNAWRNLGSIMRRNLNLQKYKNKCMTKQSPVLVKKP